MSRFEARAGTKTAGPDAARLPVAHRLRPFPPFAAGNFLSCPLRTVNAVATAAPASGDTAKPG